MENLVTSKEVSEKLKKLGVRQESVYKWHDTNGVEDRLFTEEQWEEYAEDNLPPDGEMYSAFLVTELKEPLKPYMKDIEISARDDIFNPDFWGNYLISKLTK